VLFRPVIVLDTISLAGGEKVQGTSRQVNQCRHFDQNGLKNIKNQAFLKIFGPKIQILVSVTDLLDGLLGTRL